MKVLKLTLGARLAKALDEMHGASGRFGSLDAFATQLIEVAAADFRLRNICDRHQRLSGRASKNERVVFSHRRADNPAIVQKVANLRFLLSAAQIARRLNLSQSSVLRILKSVRAAESARQTYGRRHRGNYLKLL